MAVHAFRRERRIVAEAVARVMPDDEGAPSRSGMSEAAVQLHRVAGTAHGTTGIAQIAAEATGAMSKAAGGMAKFSGGMAEAADAVAEATGAMAKATEAVAKAAHRQSLGWILRQAGRQGER